MNLAINRHGKIAPHGDAGPLVDKLRHQNKQLTQVTLPTITDMFAPDSRV